MLARYLGSKQAILGPLVETIASQCEPGAHVVDAFSGSLAVSLALKQAGYRVTANDVNLFSAVLGEAYLLPSAPPSCDAHAILGPQRAKRLLRGAAAATKALEGSPGFAFLNKEEWRRRYENFLALQQHLLRVRNQDLPVVHRRTHFFDAYCEDGKHSAFVSSRGARGNRRFFNPANARRIDLAINTIRMWHRDGATDMQTHALLLSTLLRAVERVSNTQGTYHDFPRSAWDSRALAPLAFELLPLDGVIGGVGGHRIGRECDSLDFIKDVDEHQVLYLDPPYNFRQYTAYYFLPNVLCRYPDLDDPDDYFAGLRYVRGQRPDDDFTSTFCKPSKFIDEMRTLIQRARCRTVVVSYFTGPNHWSAFDSGPDDTGRQRLSAMLSEEIFEPGSLSVIEIPRRNYASYGGFTARTVNELLLVARKVGQNTVYDCPDGVEGRVQAMGLMK